VAQESGEEQQRARRQTRPPGQTVAPFDLAMRRLVVIAVVALTTAVIWHEVRLGIIESTRFTREDAAKIPNRDDVQELKVLMRDVGSRLSRLEATVEANHR